MTLHVMAEKVAFFLVRKEIVNKEKAEIYSFGFEIMFAALINGILVIAAALIMGVLGQTVLMLVPFMLIRTNAGGFHAQTHAGCVFGFLSVYIITILAVKSLSAETARTAGAIGLLAAAALVMKIGALPHKNRPVSGSELTHFKGKTRLICLLLSTTGLVGLYFMPSWFIYFALGLSIAAGSLLAGCIQVGYEGRCKK